MSANTEERLLYLLKTRGPLTAQQLADILSLTSMGARRQLETACGNGLVQFDDRHAGIGRPGRWWSLTGAGHARFPDRHGDVVVQLIGHMRQQFGDTGIEQLIAAREAQTAKQYHAEIDTKLTLAGKLKALVDLRTREGYMAELIETDDGWDFIEHHCPICAAASECMAFCRSELQLFRSLFPNATINRIEHLLSDGARCAYRIVPA
jgi:predicted ArsR family transcriptional regulator